MHGVLNIGICSLNQHVDHTKFIRLPPLEFSVSALNNGVRTLELRFYLGGIVLEINAQMKFYKNDKTKDEDYRFKIKLGFDI